MSNRGVQAAAGALILLAGITPSSQAFNYERVQEKSGIDESEVVVTATASTYHFPVLQPLGISQGYHALHHGVDIRAPKGSPVVAVAEGVVVEVREQAFGYGKYVRIVHKGAVASLYAHLNSIAVQTGQRVSREEEIGTIGTTGWATGPHLHFELDEAGKTMNPSEVVNKSD